MKKNFLILAVLIVLFFPFYVVLTHIGAISGSSAAQAELGYWYHQGAWLHPKNRDKAIYWYESAAKENDPRAQFNLGLLMEKEKKYIDAASWYLRSALQDNDAAQNNLAILYYDGRGVKKNFEKSNLWFEKSASKGNANAQYSLGLAYAKGKGVKKNLSTAFHWIEIAANNDLAAAQTHLGMLYMLGDGVSVNNDLALKWAKRGFANGDPKAYEIINLMKELKSTEN